MGMMTFTFALDYWLKYEDKVVLLGQDGRNDCDDYVVGKLETAGIDPEAPVAARRARELRAAYFDGVDEALRAKLTVQLIEVGVREKFGREMPRKDQRVWARIQDVAEDTPASAELSTSDALWLVELFFGCATPKHGGVRLEPTAAWNKFGHQVARHLDAFESALEALARRLYGVAEPPESAPVT